MKYYSLQNKRHYLLLIILSTTCLFCNKSFLIAQETIQQRELWINELTEGMDKESYQQDISIVIDRLSELINNPILINFTNKEELEQLPFLSDIQIENFLFYLYTNGPMKTLNELLLVDDFDRHTIDLVLPFFKITEEKKKDPNVVQKLFKSCSNQVVTSFNRTLNEKYGYVDKSDEVLAENPNLKYRGLPIAYTVRYRFDSPVGVRAGFLLGKDGGEKGIDSYTFYLQYKRKDWLENLILGDYKVRFGCGLIMNNNYSLGKNNWGASMIGRSSIISPYASADEYNYLRGIAFQLVLDKRRHLKVHAFYSNRQIDTHQEENQIRSVKKDGLHRLPSERAIRNNAIQSSGGMQIVYQNQYKQISYEIGLGAVFHYFSLPYEPALNYYNQYYFRGRCNSNYAYTYKLRYRDIRLLGETALAENGKMATLHSLTYSATSDLAISIIHRYYHRGYNAWMGKSFSEGSHINNESGLAMYVNYNFLRFWSCALGADFFRFPWVRSGVAQSSDGIDTYYQLSYQQHEKWRISTRYRLKMNDKNVHDPEADKTVINKYQRHSLALQTESVIAQLFFLRSSLEGVCYHIKPLPSVYGFLISQQAGYRPNCFPLQVDLGISLFDTKNSDATVYLSEKHILYGFGIPSFYGKGMHFSCNLQADILRSLTCWIKLTHTHYFDRDNIGSGLEKINGCSKTDLSFQFRYKF